MSEQIIKISECNHPYWDENRCIDCGKEDSQILRQFNENIWKNFDVISPLQIGGGN